MQKLIAFLFLASQAFGQTINIAPTHQPYQLIVASVDVDPLQNFVSWEMSLDWNREEVGNTVYFCAPPGAWRIGVKTTALIDGKIGPSKRLTATFTVSGAPTPTPGPVVPTPVDDPPGPLAVALGAGVDRLVVAAFFRDLADVVQLSTTIKTTDQFREAQRVAVATLKQTKRFPDSTPELNKQISDRIAAAIGLDDVQMDASKRAALVAALRKIAEDF